MARLVAGTCEVRTCHLARLSPALGRCLSSGNSGSNEGAHLLCCVASDSQLLIPYQMPINSGCVWGWRTEGAWQALRVCLEESGPMLA